MGRDDGTSQATAGPYLAEKGEQIGVEKSTTMETEVV